MRRFFLPGLAVGIASWLSAYILYPQLRVFELGLPSLRRVLALPVNQEALWNSLILSLATVLGALPLGAMLAWAVGVYRIPGRGWVQIVALWPLALPPLIGVVALYLLLEGGWMALHLPGMLAVWLVHVYALHPYGYLFTRARLEQVDGAWWEAAALLGVRGVRRFVRLTLPVFWPAWRRAVLLIFLVSMSSFTAPLLFAFDERVLTTQIYYYKLNGDLPSASALSVVLVLVGLILFGLLEGTVSPMKSASKGSPRPLRRSLSRTGRLLGGLFAGGYGLFVCAPLLLLFGFSFQENPLQWLSSGLSRWTIRHYTDILSRSEALQPLWSSFQMALLATGAVLLTGVVVAYLARRLSGGRLLLALCLLPYALPGTVVGIQLLAAFSRPHPFTLSQVLVGTFWILPLAYFVRTLPLGVQAAASGWEAVQDRLLEAARTLGARRGYLWRRLVLPLLGPALLGGGWLVFVQAATEFVASILLYTYANRPVSVEIFSYLRLFDFGGAAAYSVLLVVGLGGVSLFFRRPGRWMSGWG